MKLFRLWLIAAAVAFLLFLVSGNSLAQNGENARALFADEIHSSVEEDYPYLDNLYKYLHAHPELSFHESETAAQIAEELGSLGFEVTTDVGGHGLVGVLKNGDGPTVMIRTDLDALPVKENTGLDYASTVTTTDDQGKEVGVMHACGHDVHMTVFTGTARILTQMKDAWQGTLVLIGQPAEEKGAGAKAMLADGLYTRFPRPDYAIALHVNAGMPTRSIGYCKGYALANVDAVDILVRGIGGHGAYPHTTKDPVVISAQIIMALQTIVSREIKPIEPAVVTVGSIHGGTKHNIIPDEVHLQLTLRSYSDQVRNQTIATIRRISKGIAQAAGVPEGRLPVVTVQDEFTPATYNDPELTERLVKVWQRTLGSEHVVKTEPVMGGEDFGRYGREEPNLPICMFWLGTVSYDSFEDSQQEGEPLPSLHSSRFAPIPEPTIKTGVKAMTSAALELLQAN
ncbi:amidohydrolase [candidate division KSB1 bacterium]|nr:amidohydrolase [candidate division KSB1 bacterium]NIR73323.1 amidohydrolase [candidate division KSB1 bacterium]NIS27029.1 amidohydrolase [candidate division KSB1 bacterium]NIT73869.1 amidohydrolase [candidate division KSB1 bacterium]NIU27774.1 amidohydrolase [candidate division KSB1 bacterium]